MWGQTLQLNDVENILNFHNVHIKTTTDSFFANNYVNQQEIPNEA